MYKHIHYQRGMPHILAGSGIQGYPASLEKVCDEINRFGLT